MREDYYAGLEDRYFLTFDQAKKQRLVIDFDATPPAPAPGMIGVTVIDNIELEDVVPYMDWVSVPLFLFECSFSVLL
jgi:5-methyltetrahydrofolate--homocysteine methyltransferase